MAERCADIAEGAVRHVQSILEKKVRVCGYACACGCVRMRVRVCVHVRAHAASTDQSHLYECATRSYSISGSGDCGRDGVSGL